MAKGRKISIYIPEDTCKFYDDLVGRSDTSASETVAKAIYDANIADYANVSISEGAYLCLAEGRFDLLNAIKLENGETIIAMKEDAYRLPDGSRGELADAKDKLFEYLKN